MAGTVLKIGTTQNEPYNSATYLGGKWVGGGAAFEIIKYMQDKFKFDFVVKTYNQTRILDGLLNQEIDVAAAFLPIIPEQNDKIRFSTRLYEEKWVFLMKRPKTSATEMNLLTPFDPQVWFVILASVLITGPLFYSITRVKEFLEENQTRNQNYNLWDYLWFIYGGILKQGSIMKLDTSSISILIATWWLYVILVTSSYSASLTALITMNTFTLPLKKVSDIGDLGYQWMAKSESNFQQLITEPILKTSIGHGNYTMDNSEDLIQTLIKYDQNLFIGEKIVVDQMIHDNYFQANRLKCDLVRTKWSLTKADLAFAYSKSFELHPLFDKTLRQLFEGGVIKKMLTRHLPEAEYCPLQHTDSQEFQSTNMASVYVLIGALLAIALCIFLLEIVTSRYKPSAGHKHKMVSSKNKKSLSSLKLFYDDNAYIPYNN